MPKYGGLFVKTRSEAKMQFIYKQVNTVFIHVNIGDLDLLKFYIWIVYWRRYCWNCMHNGSLNVHVLHII